MCAAINLLVVGECGDGKSTLINALRDRTRSEQPMCGKSPLGVTKDVVVYPCPAVDGVPVNMVDTPGVGDHHVTPTTLVSKIEYVLAHQDVLTGGIRGVLVTTPVPDGRVKLGAQIVQTIVEKGFVAADNGDMFDNVIFVGTKLDKADEEEQNNFMFGSAGQPSVQELFFAKSKSTPNRQLCVMVSLHDYSPLQAAIRKLPAVAVRYQKPAEDVMADALAEKIGVGVEAMQQQVEENRQQMQELQRRALEEEMRRKSDEQEQARKQVEVQRKLQERQRIEEEEQRQHERELEQLRRQQEEWLRQNEEKRRQQQEVRRPARDQLHYGEALQQGEYLQSKNGEYALVMQADGNLVGYRGLKFIPPAAFWSSRTHGKGTPPYRAVFQTDGNFVVYDGRGRATWASATHNKKALHVILQNDRNVVVYNVDKKPMWASGTHI